MAVAMLEKFLAAQKYQRRVNDCTQDNVDFLERHALRIAQVEHKGAEATVRSISINVEYMSIDLTSSIDGVGLEDNRQWVLLNDIEERMGFVAWLQSGGNYFDLLTSTEDHRPEWAGGPPAMSVPYCDEVDMDIEEALAVEQWLEDNGMGAYGEEQYSGSATLDALSDLSPGVPVPYVYEGSDAEAFDRECAELEHREPTDFPFDGEEPESMSDEEIVAALRAWRAATKR